MPASSEIRLASALSRLRETLIDILRDIPGSEELHIFGSLQQHAGDGYSDLDFELFSCDTVATTAVLLPMLHARKPVDAAWMIRTDPGSWAVAILFAGESLFHKVDLGVLPVSKRDAWSAAVPSSRVWSQPAPVAASPPGQEAPAMFIPQPGTHAHFVLGELLGATRYARARRRGHLLSCWRFASALAHATLSLRTAIAAQRPVARTTMSTGEYREADSILPEAERTAMLQHFDFTDPAAVDETVRSCANDLIAQLAATDDEQIPAHLAARFRKLLDEGRG